MGAIIYRDPTTGQTVPQGGGGGTGGPDEVRVGDEQPTDEAWELWADMDDESGVGIGTPTGGLLMFAGQTAPAGWLLCDGSAVSRTTYAALFAVVGTVYGVGNGSTTFNLPNLKGRVPVGLDASQAEFNAQGKTGGAKTHALAVAEMPTHAHGVSDPTHGHGVNDPAHAHMQSTSTAGGGPWTRWTYQGEGASNVYRQEWTTEYSATGISIQGNYTGIGIQNTGGGAAHNNLQPYIAMHWLIKA